MGMAGRDGPADVPCLRADDEEQLARGFEDCRPHLMKLCRRILGQADGTEDAVHDTYLRAFGNWSRFDGVNLPGWLSRIAQHICIDQIRARLPVRPLDEGDEPVTAGEEMRRVTAIQIRTILGKLPDQQRQCLKLFYIEGFSAKVKSYLQNGRRNFILEWEALKQKP